MGYGRAVLVDNLRSVELGRSQLVVYDREIGLRLLYQDPDSGAEHYLIRYPAGLKARSHRHTAAHTIVVLEGRLEVNNEVIGPGAYCHFHQERQCGMLLQKMTPACSSLCSMAPSMLSQSTNDKALRLTDGPDTSPPDSSPGIAGSNQAGVTKSGGRKPHREYVKVLLSR